MKKIKKLGKKLWKQNNRLGIDCNSFNEIN